MDWASIFIYDTTWSFAAEIVIRVVVMFTMIILFLRFTGKRGVRQLSIFELTIILSLGSIAGDPMFTKDLPLIQAVLIMSTVIALYRSCTWLMMKYQPFEDLLEGTSLYIVEEGVLILEKIELGQMSHDEFFLRCACRALNTWVKCGLGCWRRMAILVYCCIPVMRYVMVCPSFPNNISQSLR